MRYFVYLIFFLFIVSSPIRGYADPSIRWWYDQSIGTLDSNPDSSSHYAQELLRVSDKKKDTYGKVQANYILGWLSDNKRGNYGQALIYYMEAIRHGEAGKPYEGLEADLLSIKENIGILYSQFNDYKTAESYFIEAIDQAKELGNTYRQIKIMGTLGSLYKDWEHYPEALEVITAAEKLNADFDHLELHLLLHNKKGIVYKADEQHLQAIAEYVDLLEMNTLDTAGKYYKYRLYALNNMAESYLGLEDPERAVELFEEAIEAKLSIRNFPRNNPLSLYHSMKGLADAYYMQKDLDRAEVEYKNVEAFIDTINDRSNSYYFNLYARLADLYELQDNFVAANQYRKIYGEELKAHIEYRAEIERIDKKYNLELIAQRYHSLVAQQEKNRKIELYGGMAIGLFVIVIAVLIAFNSYQRYVLKSELERSIRILDV